MNKNFLFIILLLSCLFTNAQTKKFDTTVKMADVGYKLFSNNKKVDNNTITVTPVGFKNHADNLSFPVRGLIKKALIDDFNDDGYPDVVFYSYDENNRAQIYAIASVANNSCAPIYMPDIYIDAKLRDGYQGQDDLTSMGGFLLRKFPVFKVDSVGKSTTIIGKRIVEYKAKKDASSNPDHPTFKFEVFKSYDEMNN